MRAVLLLGLVAVAACGGTAEPRTPRGPATAALPPDRCGTGAPLVVHFYDAGQALAALVDLPDGRRVLVDTGESPTRAGCGEPCRTWHERILSGLRADLGEDGLDLLWITH